jgi:hypothetical protein
MPPKPNTAAIIAMMKKTAAHRNMDTSLSYLDWRSSRPPANARSPRCRSARARSRYAPR